MTTAQTSVTDAEARNVLLAFKHWYLWGSHDVEAMRRALEQFTQSRQPSSEAVELRIDYTVLQAFADEHYVPYNQLCAAVHEAAAIKAAQ